MRVNLHGELAEVPDDLLGIVKEIYRLWPNLRVQYLDPDRAGLSDPPFRIVEMTQQGPVQVMAVWCLDQTVLDKLHMSNGQKFDIEALVDKENAKIKAAQEAKNQEELGAASDLLVSMQNQFNKGKMAFQYTNDVGEKRVVREDGTRGTKKVEVL